MADLYTLYSPSCWSKRFGSSEQVIEYHLKFIENASATTRIKIPCQLNIPYGTTERTKIDVFGTNLSPEAPIFVFIHGGYWQEKSITRSSYHFIAENLYKHSIKSIFVGYDLCPDVIIAEIIKQVENAAKWCLDHAKKNKSKGLYFGGHSAGAHLVASLFTNFIESFSKEEQAIVKGAVLISGVFDLTPIQKTAINDLLKLDERTAFELSPSNKKLVGAGSAFYSIVGENESREFIKQSRNFSEKLQHLGMKSEFFVIENTDHYDIIERFVDDEYDLTKRVVDIIMNKKYN